MQRNPFSEKNIDIWSDVSPNTSAVSGTYLHQTYRKGNLVSFYAVFGLNGSLSDNTTLYTVSGIDCNPVTTPILANNGAFLGQAMLEGNIIRIILPTGASGTARFSLVGVIK